MIEKENKLCVTVVEECQCTETERCAHCSFLDYLDDQVEDIAREWGTKIESKKINKSRTKVLGRAFWEVDGKLETHEFETTKEFDEMCEELVASNGDQGIQANLLFVLDYFGKIWMPREACHYFTNKRNQLLTKKIVQSRRQ